MGSRPLHSGHCPQDWLQWITTSSPAFQRFTWSPTFQTIPEASEPAMCIGSPCMRKTLTGLPRAAQTPLKFTPAPITSTSASLGPTAGTSTSSSFMAVSGSPSRSGRMHQASIFFGSSPTFFGTSRRGNMFVMWKAPRAPRRAPGASRRMPWDGEKRPGALAPPGVRPCRPGARRAHPGA